MKQDLLQQHFHNYGFDEMQADVLATVFEQYREEMATKHDLALLRADLKGDMTSLRSEMTALRSDLRAEMATLKADLTWRFVALASFIATVTTLVGIFAN